MNVLPCILAACGGFLLAVLWMDLMFDVQVRPYRGQAGELPEPVLASIAGYYRRVTTTARPMNHLIGLVMGVAVVTLVLQPFAGDMARWVAFTSLALAVPPIVRAGARVFPTAVRLGARSDTALEQSDLARAICRDHLLCLAGIAGFIALQLYAALA